jgi:predicted dehydrogenase
VYAQLGPDLTAHLGRIAQFNSRKDNPTGWKLRVYAAPDYWERMLAERPGQIAVLSGRNRAKVDRIGSVVRAGLHGLIDKPWVIEPEDLPKLAATLDDARTRGIVVYDGMTQRYEITCLLQKELVNDAGVFGEPLMGAPANPAVTMESVHYLLKTVAGVPNRRPPWFFDIREQGEGLTDVGTHLVDLVQWTLSSGRPIDHRKDIRVLRARRWPTVLNKADLARVTGEADFPGFLTGAVREGGLQYYCNNSVDYTLRGIHVKLDVKWGFEAQGGGGDSEIAIFRGARSSIEVRNNEVYVVPNSGNVRDEVAAALRRKLGTLQQLWPGLSVEENGDRFRVVIPPVHRIGHEAHFSLLVKQFLQYVKDPKSLPDWETSFLMAKYYVTTQAVAMARLSK